MGMLYTLTAITMVAVQTISASNQMVEVQALGRSITLGMLYDIRTDAVIPAR